jgi:hypothetical protein
MRKFADPLADSPQRGAVAQGDLVPVSQPASVPLEALVLIAQRAAIVGDQVGGPLPPRRLDRDPFLDTDRIRLNCRWSGATGEKSVPRTQSARASRALARATYLE